MRSRGAFELFFFGRVCAPGSMSGGSRATGGTDGSGDGTLILRTGASARRRSAAQFAEINGSCTISTSGKARALTVDLSAALYMGNGASLTTTSFLNNAGYFDVYGNGAAATLGGALFNSGTVNIGSTGLTASTTVQTTNLYNTGTLILAGNTTSGTANQATLKVTGSNPTTVAGTFYLEGDFDLQLTNSFTGVGVGASFYLYGAQARASIGAGSTEQRVGGAGGQPGRARFRRK